jgi:hypothetical protein
VSGAGKHLEAHSAAALASQIGRVDEAVRGLEIDLDPWVVSGRSRNGPIDTQRTTSGAGASARAVSARKLARADSSVRQAVTNSAANCVREQKRGFGDPFA